MAQNHQLYSTEYLTECHFSAPDVDSVESRDGGQRGNMDMKDGLARIDLVP